MATREVEVAESEAIPEREIVAFTVDGRAVAVVRADSKLYAFDDCCTHEQCPLSTGWLEGKEVECDRHGARFDIETGAVTLPPAYAALLVHQVIERDGKVFVVLSEAVAGAE